MTHVIIRQLQEADVEAAAGVAIAALPVPAGHDEGERPAWISARMRQFMRTDPGGAWVAEEDGVVVGVATALVRDGIWALSLMAVLPDRHARGVGTRLLHATLRHGDGGRGGLIASSTDPRAMRMYARAGFDLRPCVALAGLLDHDATPAGLRAAPSDDVEQAAALAAPVRGGAYDPADLQLYLDRPGAALLLLDGRGFAIHRGGSPFVLAALDDAAAADLLWSCFAAAPRGGTVHLDFVTAGQDWAIRTGLDAGLVLSPEGPLYTRGKLGPLRPWLPSGAVL
jgi:GNAT superfamily N-acetyltransferase